MRYRLQRHDGTDCSATMVPITVLRMVPIQRYRQFSGSSRVKIKEDVNRTLFNPYTLFTFWHHYQNPIVILLHYLINIAGQFF